VSEQIAARPAGGSVAITVPVRVVDVVRRLAMLPRGRRVQVILSVHEDGSMDWTLMDLGKIEKPQGSDA
jgi:hypothetical protein